MKTVFSAMALLSVFWLLFLSATASVAKSGQQPSFSLPAVPGYQDNPNQYRYASVTSANIFQSNKQMYTTAVLKPVGTYLLYSESVTFCGDQGDKFNFNSGSVVVLMFSKTMHRRDCYNLIRIDVIEKSHLAGVQ